MTYEKYNVPLKNDSEIIVFSSDVEFTGKKFSLNLRKIR